MKIAMIAAMANNRVIGLNNKMPWHLPDDLKFFKATTQGKTVIMGRKTFESIGAKPLPNRRNLVISHNPNYDAPGAEVFTGIESALEVCSKTDEVIMMGGGQLYQQMLPKAHKLYLTLVAAEVEGDAFFPDWQRYDWTEVSRIHHASDEHHAFAFDFVTLVRSPA